MRLLPSLAAPRPAHPGWRTARQVLTRSSKQWGLSGPDCVICILLCGLSAGAARGIALPASDARLNFEHTEQLLALAGPEASGGNKFNLGGGITVERSPREIRLTRAAIHPQPGPEYAFPHPRGSLRPPPNTVCACAARHRQPPSVYPKVLEGRRSGDSAAQPRSQESCRGSGSAPCGGSGAGKLAGGRVERENSLDAGGGSRCARVLLRRSGFARCNCPAVIGWSVPAAYNFGHAFHGFGSRFRFVRSRIAQANGRVCPHTVLAVSKHRKKSLGIVDRLLSSNKRNGCTVQVKRPAPPRMVPSLEAQ